MFQIFCGRDDIFDRQGVSFAVCPLDPVSDLVAAQISPGKFQIIWKESPGALGYRIIHRSNRGDEVLETRYIGGNFYGPVEVVRDASGRTNDSVIVYASRDLYSEVVGAAVQLAS